MSMTDAQMAGRLNAISRASVSLHGGGYSYESGAPSEACWDVRWLLAHIDGLSISSRDKDRRISELEVALQQIVDEKCPACMAGYDAKKALKGGAK